MNKELFTFTKNIESFFINIINYDSGYTSRYTINERIEAIKTSIFINYKTYIALFIITYLIIPDKLISGYIIMILGLIYVYLGHMFYHVPTSLFFYFIHIYHHDHDDYSSIYQEVIMEFLGIMMAVVLVTGLNNVDHINYIYDPFIFFYLFLFYSTVHFVNYTFLRINNYHTKHHKDINTNIFPDICDIIFNTKYNCGDLNFIENTDHWLPNIFFSGICVYYIRKYYFSLNEEGIFNFKKNFILFYLFLFTIMICFSYYTFVEMIKKIDIIES